MRVYRIRHRGAELTVQLSDEDAKTLGLSAEDTESLEADEASAYKPRNKRGRPAKK
ncbi:hypothetical protein [Devriesea agamarum]|uniref:hypothetical protein n=1 Tax=Devriesea agamarum TaxID=472569 RepID=UPI0012ECCE19|nr:hypothetical protein [Devriesea agamarum]